MSPSAPPVFLISGRDPLLTSGGSESYVIAHARAAILAGYTPHVFSIAGRSEELETDFGLLHRVFSPVRPARSITCALQHPWFVPAVVRTVERVMAASSDPALIHSFGAWSVSGAAAVVRLRRRRTVIPVSTVFTSIEHETHAKLDSMVVRESPIWRTFYRGELAWARRVTTPFEIRALREMRAVIVNYDNVAAQIAACYGTGLPIRRLTYSPPGAFADSREPAMLPEPLRGFGDPDAPLIVSVSRHDGRKGLDTLIGALTLLRDEGPPFRACLVGPGVLLNAHRRLIRRLGLEGQVLVPGRVPDAMAYLRAADVYVLPSRQEGSGSVALLEALQAGIASVATNVDGLPEDVSDEREALLVPPGDRRVLARAIRRLIEDPALRERLGACARARFEERFAAPVFAREMRALYNELGLTPAGHPGAA